jgi:hypothetical protein
MRKKGSKTRYPGVKMVSPGLFQLRVKVINPRTGREREVTKLIQAASAKEAAVKRANMLAQEVDETSTERIKVGAFAKSWIESKAAVVSEYTLEGYVGALDLHVLPVLGDFYYDTVGHLEVQMMVNKWLTEKKKDGTPRYALRSVKDWFWRRSATARTRWGSRSGSRRT